MDKVEVNDTESVQLQAGLVGLSMATEGQVKFEDLWDEKKLKFVSRIVMRAAADPEID